VNQPDKLSAARLRSEIANVTIGREIVVLEETTSTNDVVRQMATGDWPEGLVVFAERQTAGRGQHGNSWESAAYQGLWFSILLKPQLDIKDSARLTDWAAKTVAATIENHCPLPASIKHPNDVYIADRKVAGVLVEMCARPQAPHFSIIGIGLNVNQSRTDFSEELQNRATSLAIVRGSQLDRHQLAVELLLNLDRTYRDLRGR
jgi:BirA family transcriptional regulator, biotin operon repressor / biotin---[acetyl-CoA-carboxylase] ligase